MPNEPWLSVGSVQWTNDSNKNLVVTNVRNCRSYLSSDRLFKIIIENQLIFVTSFSPRAEIELVSTTSKSGVTTKKKIQITSCSRWTEKPSIVQNCSSALLVSAYPSCVKLYANSATFLAIDWSQLNVCQLWRWFGRIWLHGLATILETAKWHFVKVWRQCVISFDCDTKTSPVFNTNSSEDAGSFKILCEIVRHRYSPKNYVTKLDLDTTEIFDIKRKVKNKNARVTYAFPVCCSRKDLNSNFRCQIVFI